jgi:hypothetical protein
MNLHYTEISLTKVEATSFEIKLRVLEKSRRTETKLLYRLKVLYNITVLLFKPDIYHVSLGKTLTNSKCLPINTYRSRSCHPPHLVISLPTARHLFVFAVLQSPLPSLTTQPSPPPLSSPHSFLFFPLSVPPLKGPEKFLKKHTETIYHTSPSLLMTSASTRLSNIRHPASLAPLNSHNPALVHLMGKRVSMEMIQYVARHASTVIRVEGEDLDSSSDLVAISSSPTKVSFFDQKRPPAHQLITLETFILHLVKSSNVQVPTLLTTLILLDRLRAKLPPMAKGLLPISIAFRQYINNN